MPVVHIKKAAEAAFFSFKESKLLEFVGDTNLDTGNGFFVGSAHVVVVSNILVAVCVGNITVNRGTFGQTIGIAQSVFIGTAISYTVCFQLAMVKRCADGMWTRLVLQTNQPHFFFQLAKFLCKLG